MKALPMTLAALFVAFLLASCGSSSSNRDSGSVGPNAVAPTDRADMDLGRPLWRKR
jgi:hypothetical protein